VNDKREVILITEPLPSVMQFNFFESPKPARSYAFSTVILLAFFVVTFLCA
jgi:hypothetical protein